MVGLYWIDPNGGCRSDAIPVQCNFYWWHSQKLVFLPIQHQVELEQWDDKIYMV